MSFEITTESPEYCKLKVSYVADQDTVLSKKKKVVSDFRKYPVPGFRTGKATDIAVYKKYKKQVDQSVVQEMLNHANDDIVYDTKIRSIGNPQVEEAHLDGNYFKCDLMYLTKPDFKLNQYKDFEIPKPPQENKDVLVEKSLEDLRRSNADLIPFTDEQFVQEGDKLTIAYEASNGMSDNAAYYVAGSGDLDPHLYGMKLNETKEFTLKLDNEEISVKATLHMGLKSSPVALDDSLAKKVGFETFEELIAGVRAKVGQGIEAREKNRLFDQVKLRLIEGHDFEVPSWLVLHEAQHICKMNNINYLDLQQEEKDSYLERGKNNVKLSLILDSIQLEEKDVEISDMEAVERIKELLSSSHENVDEYLEKISKNGTLYGLVASYKTQYVLEWILKNSKVIE